MNECNYNLISKSKKRFRKFIKLVVNSSDISDQQKRKQLGAWRDDLYFPKWCLGVITVPKSANTTLKRKLLGQLSCRSAELIRQDVNGHADRQYIHEALRKSEFSCRHERLLKSDVKIIVATVRHPVSRIVSFYSDKVIGSGWPPYKKNELKKLYDIGADDSFDRVVSKIFDVPDEYSEIHFRSQLGIIGEDIISDSRFISIRTESFDKDFSSLSSKIGLIDLQVQRENVSSSSSVSISRTSRLLIEKRYERDLEKFYA